MIVLLILVALAFDFMNGFHDAANSIATVVSTRVLSPRMAVAWAAFFNFVAAFGFGVAVATTVGKGIVAPEAVDHAVIFAALVAAFLWDLITWRYGLPSSSSHALIAGLAGAGVAKAGFRVLLPAGLVKVVGFIVVSPLVGFLLGALFMLVLIRLVYRATPAPIDRALRARHRVARLGHLRHPGEHDAHHHGRDRRRRQHAALLGRALGRGAERGAGVDPDHPVHGGDVRPRLPALPARLITWAYLTGRSRLD